MSTLIGSIGVALLLLAFFLNLFGYLAAGRRYALMNFIGGALSAYASYLIDYMPFVVLEGTWAAVALVALLRPSAQQPARH